MRVGPQSQQLTPTPAMMAGLTDTLWSIDDLYDAVMKHQADKKHRTRVDNLLAKLRSLDSRLGSTRIEGPALVGPFSFCEITHGRDGATCRLRISNVVGHAPDNRRSTVAAGDDLFRDLDPDPQSARSKGWLRLKYFK
jgi:hypothetical protein